MDDSPSSSCGAGPIVKDAAEQLDSRISRARVALCAGPTPGCTRVAQRPANKKSAPKHRNSALPPSAVGAGTISATASLSLPPSSVLTRGVATPP